MKKLTLLIAMLMATSAWAEWTYVTESKDTGATYYVDIETIKSNNTNFQKL